MMLSAAAKALGDLSSPDFRAVLAKALGLTVVLFMAVLLMAEVLIASLTHFSWPWADWALGIGTGLALLLAFFFLMPSVTAAFAGLFLDRIAAMVEARHYPRDPPGTPLPPARAAGTAVRFFLLVLAVNIAVLPVVVLGVGAVALVAVNAYLLSREYFEMVAMRHLPEEEAKLLRRDNAPAVFAAGLVPALMALVPLVNLAVPLFATAFFTHLFKSVRASSA